MVPIFKSGTSTDLTNYSPILSYFSKIFEKVIFKCVIIIINHMIDFIDKYDILYKHQFGFMKSHSIQQALIRLIDKISKAIDKGKCNRSLLDLIQYCNHTILKKKIQIDYGF